ncbi:hypothetical protein Tco_0965287 [Tanacetum coccineum]
MLVQNPSPNQPFIFDIDGHSLEFGREDFCLITSFRFGKVSLHPKEEDHSEFGKRVFLKNANLKGEHLLELVKNDVEFNQLDDEDAIWGLETFSNSIHWWRKDEKVIPHGVSWSNRSKFEKLGYDRLFYSENAAFYKLTPSAIEMNEICNSKSVHTRVRTEVRQEVHVRTKVRRFVDKEENDSHSHNVLVGGLDHQSMERVSQCMNDDQNCNDVPDNFPVDGPEYQSMEGVSQCTTVDHVDKVREIINDFFDTPPIGPDSVQGWEPVSIRHIQCVGYGVLGFLGVGTTFDIFQNIHLLYFQYGVLVFSGYGVLIMWSSWSLMSACTYTPYLP